MGLDMMVFANKYFIENDAQTQTMAAQVGQLVGVPDQPAFRVTFEVLYWRKANAIHNWFVENCMGGEDDCRTAYVRRRDLARLMGLCCHVLARPSQAADILPACDGFFFGDTEYDDNYFEQIRYTASELKTLLRNPAFKDCRFEYASSW